MRLQNYLATQEIHWTFNLAKSPWWGGMYERLIKEIKKTLYKTLGKTHLTFCQLETVIMDIERHLNNRPLTYVESNHGEEQSVILWGQNAYALEKPATQKMSQPNFKNDSSSRDNMPGPDGELSMYMD